MPYISLQEQGPQPGEIIQNAAAAFLARRQQEQQLKQSAEAFPVEQQLRRAQASEASKKASAFDRNLALQQQAQDLSNQQATLAVAFQKETDPIKKEALKQQLEMGKAQMQNLAAQVGLITAQTGETAARTGLIGKQGNLAEAQVGETNARTNLIGTQGKIAALPLANSTVTPGKLDPYGNQIITTSRTNADGSPINTTQEFEKGRGIPRVAYKQVFDQTSGQMRRIPGVVEVDPVNGELNINFPDDSADADKAAASQPDPIFRAIVDKFFDPATGKRKTKFFGSGEVQPSNASERAQLQALMRNPGQLDAYGLAGLPTTPAAAPVRASTPSAPAAAKAAATQNDGEAEELATTPGVGPGGAPVKTDATGAEKPSGAPVPIKSGKSSGGGGGKFGDLPVGAVFMQNGVRYRKTGDTTAVPADGKSASETPAMPKAGGM